jgi:hypothetical protein
MPLTGEARKATVGEQALLPHPHRPLVVHKRRDSTWESYNWSGYAVTGASGSVTDVKGSWVVPAIQGTCPSTNQYSSFWVGIDGFSSNSVEQLGTDSDCQNGVPTYYAWFEFYPHPMFIINNLAVNVGDKVSAEVKYSGNNTFTASITDVSTGHAFSTTTTMRRAQRSSAEWIAEAPSSVGGVLPLANFGVVDFGADYTSVNNTNDATVGGVTKPFNLFGSPPAVPSQSACRMRPALAESLAPDSFSTNVARLAL